MRYAHRKKSEVEIKRVCDLLIKRGASINARDKFGNTPLLAALRTGNTPPIKALIQAGADVNAKSNAGYGVLEIQMSWLHRVKNKYERLKILLDAGVRIESGLVIIKACKLGHVDCLDLLIKAGADVKKNSLDCLDAACRKSHFECLKILLDAGAEVNQISDYGRTALFAALQSDVKCIGLLIQAGVPVNHYDGSYRNVLTSFLQEHKSNKEEVGLLLYAAGEMFGLTEDLWLKRQQRKLPPITFEIPSYLQEEPSEDVRRLDEICRLEIRYYLLGLNLHENLFRRIPQLPLPKCIMSFLLFGFPVDLQ